MSEESALLGSARSTSALGRRGYTLVPESTSAAHRWHRCTPCRAGRVTDSIATHPEAAKERKDADHLALWCCLSIFGFLGFGTVVYTFAYPLVGPNGQNATAIDALYFSMVTLTTVGYGDYSIDIENNGAVAFTCVFCLLGISFVGYVLSLAVAKLLDAQEDALAHALVDANDDAGGQRGATRPTRRSTSFIRLRWGDDEWRLFNSIAIFLCFFFLGLGIFMGIEKAPFLKALFYVVTSMTTVGYGTTGSAPTTDGTKVFSTLWLGFATLSLGHMVSKIIGYKLSSKIHSIRDRVLTHALDKDLFIDIDAFNRVSDGEIDRAEWLCYNLLKGEYGISSEELNQINRRFDELDKDKSGRLTPHELGFSLVRSASTTPGTTHSA